MTDCPFCQPLDNSQYTVLQNELCMFLQQPQDVLIGSGVLVPKAHRETAFDLTLPEWTATYALLHEAKTRLEKEWQPDGYNLGWNVGSVGGQDIFHAHLHLIPRFKDEPFAGKGIRYWLKQPENRR